MKVWFFADVADVWWQYVAVWFHDLLLALLTSCLVLLLNSLEKDTRLQKMSRFLWLPPAATGYYFKNNMLELINAKVVLLINFKKER